MALSVCDFQARQFRSLKSITYPMSDLDVFVGANGVGKTNLYRALELLRSAAANTVTRDLVEEGGLTSAMWAGGRRRSEPARIRLGVGLGGSGCRGPASFTYEVEIGYPPPEAAAAFPAEPQVKFEAISCSTGRGKAVKLIERDGSSVMARAEDGRPTQIDLDLLTSETALGRLEDPSRYPELDAIRRTLLQWRFYHGLRTDAASIMRRPCAAVATPALASDGSDLAAVFATLAHIRQDTADLDEVVGQAFPGAKIIIPIPGQRASFGLSFPDFPHRVFEAHELSDGTLRFLALAGALLAYRLPTFVALNEPEASLHPDLMQPLARLVARAAARTQVWLVTHSSQLASAIAATGAGQVRVVMKRKGATEIEGLKPWGAFAEDDD